MQYVGIQTQQSRNNRRSVLLLFLFPCLVAALLYLACYLLAAMGHCPELNLAAVVLNLYFAVACAP
jgi:heat shock protein HtpX